MWMKKTAKVLLHTSIVSAYRSACLMIIGTRKMSRKKDCSRGAIMQISSHTHFSYFGRAVYIKTGSSKENAHHLLGITLAWTKQDSPQEQVYSIPGSRPCAHSLICRPSVMNRSRGRASPSVPWVRTPFKPIVRVLSFSRTIGVIEIQKKGKEEFDFKKNCVLHYIFEKRFLTALHFWKVLTVRCLNGSIVVSDDMSLISLGSRRYD